MNNAFKNHLWLRRLVILISLVIVSLILWNTYIFFQKFKHEERLKMRILAAAQKDLVSRPDSDSNTNFSLNGMIITSNNTIPMILTDEKDSILSYNNLDTLKVRKPGYLTSELRKMKIENKRIEINFKDGKQFIYYKNSNLLNKLTYYPLALILILVLFLTVIYMLFSSNKIAEQNKLWIGMAKETAHQIGTPLSSLLGWIEILKSENNSKTNFVEMEKDVERLSVITNRFSEIGSIPKLETQDVVEATRTTFDYIKAISSKQVSFSFSSSEEIIMADINLELFGWVIENVIKNAIDAMKGRGKLDLTIEETTRSIKITISDSGKGIQKTQFKRIFKPGFTTKKRGWGLGLSLSKRIIQDYHDGKIFVLRSSVDKGSSFRIQLFKKGNA